MCGHFTLGTLTLKALIGRYAVEHSLTLDQDSDIEFKGFYPAREKTTTIVPVILGGSAMMIVA